jgi:hypothetical protein
VELIVFNVGGKKHRLIASIHFNRNKLYIRHVLTHPEYDKGAWKNEFLDTLGTLIHAYEAEHYPMPQASGVEAFLVDDELNQP